MELLFLTPQLPFPPHQGTTLRTFNIVKHVAQRHSITLLSFGTASELKAATPLASLCRSIEIVEPPARTLSGRAYSTLFSKLPDMALRLESDRMRDLIERILRENKFDWVQVEGIEMARYTSISRADLPRVLFDDHNAEYKLQRSAFFSDSLIPTRWHAALYSLIQWRKLRSFERSACIAARSVVSVSLGDSEALCALDRRIKPIVISNGVDTGFYQFSSERTELPLLVFTGKMDFRPNIDAMVWFCSEILPIVQKEIPEVKLKIVGQKPTSRILRLREDSRVEVTGAVDDVRPHISTASVYVVPLRMGGGTRLKILEAMAMGKAIVSTKIGAEGLGYVDGRDLVVADSPEVFAREVIMLLRNEKMRFELGENARALVEKRYDWSLIAPLFESVYSQS